MTSCRLMFPGVRSSLVFSGFGLKPPASGFQSYFYSSLKTSPFEDNGLLFWVPDVFCKHSEVVLWNYSAFKYSFDEFVGEKVVSLSYSSTILGPPLQSLLFQIFLLFHSSLILLVSPLHMYYTFCNCHTVLGYSVVLFLHSFLFFFFS